MGSWRDDAACKNMRTALWFPVLNEDEDDEGPRRRETPRLYRQAKRVCMECPVRQECLDYALDRPEPYGMFGGLTRPERAAILRERRLAARES